LPRDLKTAIDNNSGQPAAGMAGAMWDVEAKAVADTAGNRGDPITVLTVEEVAHWRKSTEPVIAAWQKQMKEHKLDGGKLVAAVRALVAKYADEPEPQPAQSPQASQPSEQKVVTEPQRQQPQASQQPQPSQAKAEAFTRPKADAPAVEVPAASSPVAKPAPAAATKPKELDIPL
jgi:hypothetical protein